MAEARAEDIRDVSVISRDIRAANHSQCDVESDNPIDDLLHLIVPDALFKLFIQSEDGPTAVEYPGIDDRAVATREDKEICKVARILQHTVTTLEQWLYEKPEGKAFLGTMLQEIPEIKEFIEDKFPDILRLLTQRFGQLSDRSHPHFQEIEQWFSRYHAVLKLLVNFLHGCLMALMKSDTCSQGNSNLDIARAIKEVAEILHRKVTDIGQRIFQTSRGLGLFRAIMHKMPAQGRQIIEIYCREMFQWLARALLSLTDAANPVLGEIERNFAGASVFSKVLVEFFYGGVLGVINNEICQEFGTQDLPTILKEMAGAVAETCNSINHYFLETTRGMAAIKPVIIQFLVPIRPNDDAYRNFLLMAAAHVINSKNMSLPLFRSIVRFLESDHEILAMTVKAFHSCLVWSINNLVGGEPIILYIAVLEIMYQINESIGFPVPRRLFWLNGLESTQFLGNHFIQYIQKSQNPTPGPKAFTWIDVPFLLNVRTKWKFLSFEAIHIMKQDMLKADEENNVRRQFNQTIYARWFPQAQLPIIPTTLQFHVDRDNIIQSAIKNVDKHWQESESPDPVWLKPLEINFEGESALDFGGPSKDFFHQFFSALLESDIPVFKKIAEDNVSSDIWFNPRYLDYTTLEKIGLLFALLIFNGAVTTVPFPVLLYEKLLSNRDLIPTDLEKIDEEFVRRLYRLREMVPGDLEVLELEMVGLDADGEIENVLVTKENLELYIADAMKNRLAIPQVEAFAKGFNRVAAMTPLLRKIFKPEDLRDVILGEELDWKAFKESARYQPPYSPDHPVIQMFWKVFEDLEEREKRGFLKFLTGSDHVPVGGFVPFPVRRLNNRADKYRNPNTPDKYPEPGDLAPEVMTCNGFLSMDLPEYQSEEDLRYRLKLAISVVGFHREQPQYYPATAPSSNSPMLQRVVQTGMQLACGGMR